jgi:UDP-2-acetamido-3-amino-2,3-dideoxy-glucuronate N-acetyltransferase
MITKGTEMAAPSEPTRVQATVQMRADKRFADVLIHESAYVDDPVSIGAGTCIWHFCHVLGRVAIGEGCSIGQNVMIGPSVAVGNRVRIQNNVSLYAGVTLEDDVFCGPSCVFTNVSNPRAFVSRKDEFKATIVRQGATIGANATILCGNTIGAYAFVGAGAVVTADVPDYALMLGVPARRVGWMSKAGERLGSDLVCPRDGTRYVIRVSATGQDVLEALL